MKKSLIITLALVFVLGIVGTAFAATNPFVDVPAKHWSYAAVSQLASAGIVDGYGDGTFRGDKTMTRYEMAQVVAKAMAKADKADAAQKATIDKLAVEFAAELNNLGVRVSKLEANQSNIKFMGDFRTRYTQVTNADKSPSTAKAEYRLRLDATAKVDDNTSFAMRFVTREPDKAALANTTWQQFGTYGQEQAAATATIDRVNFTTAIGDAKATIGRQALKVDAYDIVMDSGAYSFDGVKVTLPAGVLNFTANYGRFLKSATPLGGASFAVDNLDVASLNVASKSGKLTYGLGYTEMNNPVLDQKVFKWAMGNASYLFTNNFSFGGEYVQNSAGTTNKNMYIAKAIYGDQVLNKKGAQNISFMYAKVGAESMWNGFTSMNNSTGNTAAKAVNYKLFDVQYAYAFSKSFNFTLDYVKVNPDVSTVTKSTMYRGVATVLF